MFRMTLLATAVLAGLAVPSKAADLVVSIEGAAPASGQILLSIFKSPDAWMKTPSVSRILALNSSGAAQSTFSLPAGTYAIALVHDVNKNGEMDTNALGLPKKAFGFSNKARARFGPPSFDRASFSLPAGGKTLSIRLDRAE